MLYFGTSRQINGDAAYNNENYQLALTHYNSALRTLVRDISYKSAPTARDYYEYAFVLAEICITNAVFLGQLKERNPIAKQVASIEKEIQEKYNEAKVVSDSFLPEEVKIKIQEKLKQSQMYWFFNGMTLHTNRAIYLMDEIKIGLNEDVTTTKITNYEEALELLQHARVYAERLGEVKALEKISELELRASDSLSDNYAELGDHKPLSREVRIRFLEEAVVYNRKALAKELQLRPNNTPILLHLSFLNIAQALFTLSNDQIYLLELSNHISKYHLDMADCSREELVEIKSFQFFIARESQPGNPAAATFYASALVDLGRVDDNELLGAEYDAAVLFLAEQASVDGTVTNSEHSSRECSLTNSGYGLFQPNPDLSDDDNEDDMVSSDAMDLC